MEKIENTRKKKILNNMEEKEHHLTVVQIEKDRSLSKKREENLMRQQEKKRNVDRILRQQEKERTKTLENLEYKSR